MYTLSKSLKSSSFVIILAILIAGTSIASAMDENEREKSKLTGSGLGYKPAWEKIWEACNKIIVPVNQEDLEDLRVKFVRDFAILQAEERAEEEDRRQREVREKFLKSFEQTKKDFWSVYSG